MFVTRDGGGPFAPLAQPASQPSSVRRSSYFRKPARTFRYENRWIRRITFITCGYKSAMGSYFSHGSIHKKKKKKTNRPIRLTCVQLIKFVAPSTSLDPYGVEGWDDISHAINPLSEHLRSSDHVLLPFYVRRIRISPPRSFLPEVKVKKF